MPGGKKRSHILKQTNVSRKSDFSFSNLFEIIGI